VDGLIDLGGALGLDGVRGDLLEPAPLILPVVGAEARAAAIAKALLGALPPVSKRLSCFVLAMFPL